MGKNEDFTRIVRSAQRLEEETTGGDAVAARLLLATLRRMASNPTTPEAIAHLREIERYVAVIGPEPRQGHPDGKVRLRASWTAGFIRSFIEEHGG